MSFPGVVICWVFLLLLLCFSSNMRKVCPSLLSAQEQHRDSLGE